MPLSKTTRTAKDYGNLPEGVRAELIDGELWDMASPCPASRFPLGA